MSKKNLNKANLVALGPDPLADLLLEVSTGSAGIKRRLWSSNHQQNQNEEYIKILFF